MKAHRYELRRLRMIAERVPDGRILDVGYAQLPNPYLPGPGRHVTGFDLNDDPRARYDERIAGDVFDLERLTDGRRFDCIVAGEFIEHVEQPYELLRLFSRSLVPSGRLILSTPNPGSLPVVVFEWLRSTRRFYTSDHTYYFTPRWVARLLERSPFRLEETAGVGIWPFGLPCPVGLSYQVLYVASNAPP